MDNGKSKFAIHLFHRDLRIFDNSSLNFAMENYEKIIPVFIFDKKQVEYNQYKSNNAIQYMFFSLKELAADILNKGGKLTFFYGDTLKIIEKIFKSNPVDALFFNRDYTPFSIQRDNELTSLCGKYNVICNIFSDTLLNEPGDVKKKDGNPYKVFSHFFNCSNKILVNQVSNKSLNKFFIKNFNDEIDLESLPGVVFKFNNSNLCIGGRSEALEKLERIKELTQYNDERDIPALPGTTFLSPAIKFGVLSIREVYWKVKNDLGEDHELIRQLYWRDFFYHIAFHFPAVFGESFKKKFDKIKWMNDEKFFKKWCSGQTGFPIVDAGMRQLNKTGYMHNRVRMIVASFLVKDLHIDWRWGEKYFAQNLIDYDPSINNGNWQWCASTGCDAQPYFRIFNPWLQQKKFDKDCLYIKKWIPELITMESKDIHSLFKGITVKGYPAPVVDHKKESLYSKLLYRKISNSTIKTNE